MCLKYFKILCNFFVSWTWRITYPFHFHFSKTCQDIMTFEIFSLHFSDWDIKILAPWSKVTIQKAIWFSDVWLFTSENVFNLLVSQSVNSPDLVGSRLKLSGIFKQLSELPADRRYIFALWTIWARYFICSLAVNGSIFH